MFTFKTEYYCGTSTSTFICPNCLEDITFLTNGFGFKCCYFCDYDITESKLALDSEGPGRFLYHTMGWPKMDRVARGRLMELRKS